jgi:hypothetical protein
MPENFLAPKESTPPTGPIESLVEKNFIEYSSQAINLFKQRS